MRFYKGIINGLAMSVIFWLLIIGCAFAQPVAKITGPTTTQPGELTAIASTGSSGDNLVWIKPDNLTIMSAGCELLDSQLFFSTMKQGTYEFILIVADKEARIDYAKHTIVVGTSTTPPTDPPTEPPTPTPGKWVDLAAASKANADLLNDEPTRTQLKLALTQTLGNLEALCATGQCPGLPEAKQKIVLAIEDVMLYRGPNSLFKDWANGWRLPNQKILDAKGIQDVPDYFNAVKAIISGL